MSLRGGRRAFFIQTIKPYRSFIEERTNTPFFYGKRNEIIMLILQAIKQFPNKSVSEIQDIVKNEIWDYDIKPWGGPRLGGIEYNERTPVDFLKRTYGTKRFKVLQELGYL